LAGSGSSTASSHRGHGHNMFHRSILSKDTLDGMEYPFLTMTKYPPGFIVHLGTVLHKNKEQSHTIICSTCFLS